MIRTSFSFAYASALLLLSFTVQANANCVVSNSILDGMTKVSVTAQNAQGKVLFERVSKLADENGERSQGFQRICQEGIEAEPILFVFPRPFRPGFHMHNVVEPLDIAFIDEQGVIVDIYKMETYVLGSNSRPLYRPSKPVVAALEAEVGYFAEQGVKVGDRVIWNALPDSDVAK
jgi:uncharacterized membrane protein (UPF0127 family)